MSSRAGRTRHASGLRSAARATATASAIGRQPAAAARFRKYADQHPKELEKLARKLDRQQTFFLRGDEYARPKGHTDDALSGWYNRRSFSIACEREYDELSYSRDLLDAVKAGYEFLIPYYEYFDKSYRMAD